MLSAACFCLSYASIGQRNVHSPAILAVALTGDQSCGFQFLEDFTGRAGLDSQLLGQFALGHTLSLAKNMEDAILAALSMPYENCLVVEDAISGVEAAHAGGMKAAAVGDAAENNIGDYILDTFSDLLKLLNGVK
jgi:phosphoglycolate phosphatase-like HAD superfamily hydrolase